jgi:hypothetical protein
MLSDQLIRIIESHAEELTRGTLEVLQSSPHTRAYHGLSANELHDRLFEIYHDLGHWLLWNTDQSIQARYEELGKQRFKESVPLAQVLWSLVLIKEHLRDSIGSSMSADSALELHRERELFRLIGRFFDRALCYTAEAYEREASRQAAAAKATHGMDQAGSSLYKRLHIH